eukprot:4121059-Amphidinium_carterae.1
MASTWYTGTRCVTPYLVKGLLEFTNSLGHDGVLIHHDQDRSLEFLAKEVQKQRTKPTWTRFGQRYSHGGQGGVEQCVQMAKGMIRSLWENMKEKMGVGNLTHVIPLLA